MTTLSYLIAATLFGMLLGCLFFMCLWQTLVRLPNAQHPVALWLGSLTIRFGLVIIAIYLVLMINLGGNGGNTEGWQLVLALILGFTIARIYLSKKYAQLNTPNRASPNRVTDSALAKQSKNDGTAPL